MENQADHPKRRCAICGGQDMPGFGACSSVTLFAGYGSGNDGMEQRVSLCGSCLDWLWKCMAQNDGEKADCSEWSSWGRE